LLRYWTHQCPEGHQRSDGNVLVIHQVFLRERQRFHKGSRLVHGRRVHQEDDAFAIAARIPLADLPVELELHSCPNLCRYDSHDLLSGYALLGSLNDNHFGGFRYRNHEFDRLGSRLGLIQVRYRTKGC
jgi:hypothetical protein